MRWHILILLMTTWFSAWADYTVVADSTTHAVLPCATIYNLRGSAIGMTDSKGIMPHIEPDNYPITLRYLGFKDLTLTKASSDTIFMTEEASQLQEVVLFSRKRPMLHVLAYVREYSSLATYTDTVFLFREKTVDFMLPSDDKIKYKGWNMPRVLTSKSYYRFTNSAGLDSVSDTNRHHFSWSDWIGLPTNATIPPAVRGEKFATDTLRGKYGAAEVWRKDDDYVNIDVDVLADTTCRRWVANITRFFANNLDFDKFKISYNYTNIINDSLSVCDLSGLSFNIESRGRGHNMFMFNRKDEPFFVSTEAQVYLMDKEYITIKEAKKWEKTKFDNKDLCIYEPLETPPLSDDILAFVERVNNIDRDLIKRTITPDHRMISNKSGRNNFKIGHRALAIIKNLTGISSYRHRRKQKHDWREFRIDQMNQNNQRDMPSSENM